LFVYVLKRLVQVPVTLILVIGVVFFLLRSSGNLLDLLLPLDSTPQQRASLSHELHFDEPLPIQFLRFVGSVVQGDFGRSLYYNRPAMSVVLDHLPATIQLAVAAMLIAVGAGLVFGILAATRAGSWFDLVVNSLTVFGQSMPSFWLGLMLILVFAVSLHWLPTSGYGDPLQFVLPAITLAAFLTPQILLLTRSAMLDVLREPYMTVAHAKGLADRVVVVRHGLRNALNPVIASIGLQFGSLMGGAVLTETVFAWPGVGRLSVEAIFHRDLPMVEASVIVLALAVMLSNLAVDIANAFIDPRVRVTR
jgi:ABC-type dipeptide/oligopeptide/nickel transport system permease component